MKKLVQLKNKENENLDPININYEKRLQKLEETILYNDSNGSNTTIQLLDDVNNYKYIEIFYRNDSYFFNSVKIIKGSLHISLITFYTVDWGTQINISDCLVENNKIILQNGRYINCQITNGSLQYGTQTTIRIIKVIGYK